MGKKHKSKHTIDKSKEIEQAIEAVDEKTKTHQYAKSMSSTSGNKQEAKKASNKGKRDSQRLNTRKYSLRSSQVSTRLLRSRSYETNKSAPVSSVSPADPIPRRKKRKRKRKRALTDELSLIRKRVRYLFTRMNYEQSLIEAYSAEGWKGLSLEKIKPEKELERAKSEILRCKVRIRDVFKRLDESLSEGRFEEALFDSEGQIDCEDIFCAKCGSKDVCANNDIILCDGNCDRGFHQKCLNPPLLTEKIPPGDQGWLCPACDCKADCLKLLNEFHTTQLSIEDTWEKIFPEAAAVANSDVQFDDHGYPSDDSEDNDYKPDVPEADTDDQRGGLSSEESESVSLSEESLPLNQGNTYDDLGLPSDDSEDDDYNPVGPESPDHQKDTLKGSTSEESDFTSDSDDFCAELSKHANNGEATSSLSECKPLTNSCKNRYTIGNTQMNSKLQPILQSDHERDNTHPLPGERQRERLDYKKLYDETYGKSSSDSSEDEEWSEMVTTPEKVKEDGNSEKHAATLRAPTRRSLRNVKEKLKNDDIVENSNFDKKEVCETLVDNTQNSAGQELALDNGVVRTHTSSGNRDTACSKHLSREASQKLLDFFKTTQYPSREMKERLSDELGLPIMRVSRWFDTTRHKMRISPKDAPGTYMGPSVAETYNLEHSTPKRMTTVAQMNMNVSPSFEDSTPMRTTAAGQMNMNISSSLEGSTQKRVTNTTQMNPNISSLIEDSSPKRITTSPQANMNFRPADDGVSWGSVSNESNKNSYKRSNTKGVNEHNTVMNILESTETPESKRRKALERELRKRRHCR